MIVRVVSTFFALLALAACGGGGGPVIEDPNTPSEESDDVAAPPSGGGADNPDEEFDDRFGTEDPDDEAGADGSELGDTLEASDLEAVALTGVAFIPGNSGSPARIEVRGGEFTEETGSRTLDGQKISLSGDIPGTFTQTSSYLQQDSGEIGVIGIATDLAAIPTDGTATFNGGSVGLILIGDNGFELRDGQSSVEIDFSEGSLRADLSGFTSVSLVSGNIADAPFDSISLEEAVLDGGTFSGGFVSTGGGQSLEEVVGASPTVLSEGHFYGTNDEGTSPTEVGGVIFAEGEDGLIYGSFIAAE